MKVKNWCSQHFIGIIISLSLFLAVWGILVYQFFIFGLPWPYPKGWNEFILGISYGLIGGIIVYMLTVEIPLLRRKLIYRKTLFVWLVNTYREFSQIPKAISTNTLEYQRQVFIPGEGPSDIIDVNCIMCILRQASDTQTVKILNSQITLLEALEYYLNKIFERSQVILNIYSEILTTKEINCLNTIITSEVYAYLKFMDPVDMCNKHQENTNLRLNLKTNNSNSLPIGRISEVLMSLYICFLSLCNRTDLISKDYEFV